MSKNIFFLMSAIINGFLCIFLFFRTFNEKNKFKLGSFIFALMLMILSVWGFLIFAMGIFDYNIIYGRLLYTIIIFLFPLINVFILVFPGEKGKLTRRDRILIFCDFIPIVLTAPLYLTSVMIVRNDFTTTPPSPVFSNLGTLIFYITIVYYLGKFFYIAIYKYKNFKGLGKLQLQYIFLGIFTTILMVLTVTIILPSLNVHTYRNTSPFWFIIFDISIILVLQNERLYSLNLIILRVIATLGITLMLMFILYSVRYFEERILGFEIFQVDKIIMDFFVAFFVSFFFIVPFDSIRQWYNKITGEPRSKVYSIYSKIEQLFAKDIEYDKLNNYTENMFHDVFNLEGSVMEINYLNSIDISLNGMILEQEADEQTRKKMKEKNHAVICYLTEKYKFVIFNKIDNYAFTNEEIDAINSFFKTVKLLYDKQEILNNVKNFNITLQQKVDKATQEIHNKMIKMEEMRQHERDMIDIMGHELRTPLTIIKNATGIINFIKNKNNERWSGEIEKQYKNIQDGLEREIKLVETMLSATKIEAKRLELHIQEVDLGEVIRQSVLAFKPMSEEKGLKIETLYDRNKDWKINADPIRIQEVVDNLVSNAVKYTNKGGVQIEVNEYEKDKEYYMVKVKDTGEGISKEAIKNLGKKFFRVNQRMGRGESAVVRPGGTGLGLYVTFGLIKAMGGKVFIESEIGKGSVFSFTIKSH